MNNIDNSNCEIPNNTIKTSPSLKQLTEYRSGPQKISAVIKNLTPAQMNYHINSDEWNINQIIVHLADTEMFFCERIRKIIVEEKPQLQSFDQDAWADRLFYDKQNYHLALELLKAQRKSTLRLLDLLPPDYWRREGIRDEKVLTLYDIFLSALHHIPTHLEQIGNIKNNLHFPLK